MGGVSPRRSAPPTAWMGLLDPTVWAGGTFLLLFFSGILRGATSGLSWMGSTMTVRPLAPRQPGREEVKAPAAGSVSLISLSLTAAAFFAILRHLSVKD